MFCNPVGHLVEYFTGDINFMGLSKLTNSDYYFIGSYDIF